MLPNTSCGLIQNSSSLRTPSTRCDARMPVIDLCYCEPLILSIVRGKARKKQGTDVCTTPCTCSPCKLTCCAYVCSEAQDGSVFTLRCDGCNIGGGEQCQHYIDSSLL